MGGRNEPTLLTEPTLPTSNDARNGNDNILQGDRREISLAAGGDVPCNDSDSDAPITCTDEGAYGGKSPLSSPTIATPSASPLSVVPVHEQDLASALSAIDNVFHARLAESSRTISQPKISSESGHSSLGGVSSASDHVEMKRRNWSDHSEDGERRVPLRFDDETDAAVRRALSETRNAVCSGLNRLVKGLSGEEYGRMVCPGGGNCVTYPSEEENDDSSNDDLTLSSSSDVNERDDSMDTDDEERVYLDREAMAQVKLLRRQVLGAVKRVRELRSQVPQRAADLIKEEMAIMSRYVLAEVEDDGNCTQEQAKASIGGGKDVHEGNASDHEMVVLDEAEENRDNSSSVKEAMNPALNVAGLYSDGDDLKTYLMPTFLEEGEEMSIETKVAIKIMEDSLIHLKDLLRRADEDLLNQIESFRNTREVIGGYVERRVKQTNAEGDYEPTNAVESAILSRWEAQIDAVEEECHESRPASPRMRFLTYLIS